MYDAYQRDNHATKSSQLNKRRVAVRQTPWNWRRSPGRGRARAVGVLPETPPGHGSRCAPPPGTCRAARSTVREIHNVRRVCTGHSKGAIKPALISSRRSTVRRSALVDEASSW
ncbi:hypothetical protein EVAR_45370_1 [Eumeta japonica]|uniref:Uncharacterized protein n=1 Tax=Eumeta variegata TaxID=151549 RepID=A0A4C1XZT5_EUMVA|nr:hypothetical protein EVAR_45370_1 [Eumeta japonica]